MIDFKNKSVIKLKAVSIDDGHKFVDDLLIDNEYIIAAFSSMRDKLVFRYLLMFKELLVVRLIILLFLIIKFNCFLLKLLVC